jgi:hypothetical protein
MLPKTKNIGMLRVNLDDIKKALEPSPQRGFDEIKRQVPPVIKQRTEVAIEWLQSNIDKISGAILSVDEFVMQA